MPIISKKRMNLGLPLWEGGPDLAMLFLAMKLVSQQPINGIASADNPVYIAAKRFLALLESSGTLSILYLQAMLLVAIYEFGQSIYPAAWMTIAACSRYADMIGLPSYKNSVHILGQVVSVPTPQPQIHLASDPMDTGDLDRTRRKKKSLVGYIHPRSLHLPGK